MKRNSQVFFDEPVQVKLTKEAERHYNIPLLKRRGLSWVVRATDTAVHVRLKKDPLNGDPDPPLAGAIMNNPMSLGWPLVLLSGVRAGCKLSLSVAKDTVFDGPLLRDVKAELEVTKGCLSTAIVGARFRGNHALVICNSLSPGNVLALRREPHNKFDRQAIGVWYEGSQLGYVAKEDHPVLNFVLDRSKSQTSLLHAVMMQPGNNPRITVSWEWPI